MKTRSYKITFSLQEGYGKHAKVHRLGDAENIIKTWLTERLHQQQPVVTGLLQEGILFFPSKNNDQDPVTISPTGIFTGELSEIKDMKRSNEGQSHLNCFSRRIKR